MLQSSSEEHFEQKVIIGNEGQPFGEIQFQNYVLNEYDIQLDFGFI